MEHTLSKYKQKILRLPDKACYTKTDLLSSDFLIDKHGDLELYYAAHNEYINNNARVIILGITPGWLQMERSLHSARHCFLQGMTLEETAYRTKLACRFYGQMRSTIIEMLNQLDVHQYLGLEDSSLLFSSASPELHSSSCIRFPVFYKYKNYSGHSPKLISNPFLLSYAEETIMRDVVQVEQAMIIPLGKAVEEVLNYFIERGLIHRERCLFGLPHPSGANGHRYKQFHRNKASMRLQLDNYFKV